MRRLVLAFALSALLLPGCKKSSKNDTTPTVNNAGDIKVPAGFSWESSRNVDITVSITDARFGASAMHSVSVYDGDPHNGGNLIAKGSASTATAYTGKLYLPNQLQEVYVMKTSPDGSWIANKVSASGSTIAYSFGATDPTVERPAYRPAAKMTTDCSSGCTSTITSNTSGCTIAPGNVICITGNNITVNFGAVTGGMVRVCGTNVTLQNLNLTGAASLLITSSGSANLSSFTCSSATANIENNGTLNGLINDGCIFTNNGTYNSSAGFSISASGTFTNNGTMNITGNFTNSCTNSVGNFGHLSITGNFVHNSGCGDFINNCYMQVGGGCSISARVKNFSCMKVTGTTTVATGIELSLYNSAMLKTGSCTVNSSASIKGYGSTSLVKITGLLGLLNILTGATVTASIQVCGLISDLTHLLGGAASGCGIYIPVTDCNDDGNGSTSYTDSDGDGLADVIDDYPADATKAHNNYYPSSTGAATAAFEDQWPTKGDFDLNDLVISYRYNVITNASNMVSQVAGTYTLLATGGSLGNGFGVQFPVGRDKVTSVTGCTLEDGQSKAVVLLFNNMRDEMAQWNTVPGVTQTSPKTYSIAVNITGGPHITAFGLSGYNPFIWNFGLGANRGREIHLSGHAPTDLANTGYFGTQDDNSNVAAGRYYVTTTGLPYAIEVPVTPFSYPTESTDITQAYLRFATWAQSGGTTYADWYSNTASGYRNTANIYTH